jgi:hypothetical protein
MVKTSVRLILYAAIILPGEDQPMGEADPFQRLFAIAVTQADDWYVVDSRALTYVPALSIEAACAMVRGKLSGRMPTVLADDLYTLADKLHVPTHRSPAYVDGIFCLECIAAALKKMPKERRHSPGTMV